MPKASATATATTSTKTKTKAVSAETLSAPVIEQATVSKTTKKEKASASAPAATAPVAATITPVATDPTDNEVVSEDTGAQFSAQIASYVASLSQLTALVSTIKSEFKALERKYSKDLKAAQKASSKRKRKTGNRAPSGFVKPTRISDSLATFLGKPLGTEMARTEVTSEINKYVKAHKLYAAENGRKIVPDAALMSLLKLEPDSELTYFNLQRYMTRHFLKQPKDGVVVEQTEAFSGATVSA